MIQKTLQALAVLGVMGLPMLASAEVTPAATDPAKADAKAAPAEAKDAADLKANTAFGNWVVTCEALSVKRSVCRLTQELTLRDSGDLVVRFIALPAKGGAVLLAQVPIGVYLPGGAVWRPVEPKDAEQKSMVWQRCLGGICEAAQALTDQELADLGTAKSMMFGYRMDPNGEPLVVNVDVAQLDAGIKALRDQIPAEDLGEINAVDPAKAAAPAGN